MNPVFPPEIIKTSVENHFSKFSKKSNLIYSVIILFAVGTVLSLFFIKTEITVQSRGIIRASSESVPISSPVIAEIVRCSVNENMLVNEGDTLLWLKNNKINKRMTHISNLIKENKDYLADINFMLNCTYAGLRTDLFNTSHAGYRQKLNEFDLKIRAQRKLFNRAKQLFENSVIPAAEMEEQQFALDKIITEKENFIQSTRNEWERLAVNYRLENKKYENEIAELGNEKENYAILAPETGYITNFNGVKAGSYVTPGQNIAFISPGGDILAEHLVSPKDIGYLYTNMPVIFQVDAYNYNQWGVASGRITNISNEVYLVNNQPYFKVRCSLNQSFLSLKNGSKGKLKKGLTTTARFKVTKRTLAQLLFDKTDNWINPNIISE